MEMPELLIADANEEFSRALAQTLSASFRVHVCSDGLEALTLLRKHRFPILVLDPTLPTMDGITMLEAAFIDNIRPSVVLISTIFTDYIRDSAQHLGIAYAMYKPCFPSTAAHRILDLGYRLTLLAPPTLESLLIQHLTLLHFQLKRQGCISLIPVLLLLAEDPTQSLTKVVYPTVARRQGQTMKQVERNIRSAIENAWKEGDPAIWQQYFPGAQSRPSNGDFFYRLLQIIQRELE